ncbi:MAG: hypothetical protein ACRDL6_02960 [Solirubrobacterales bacterium]
MAESGFERFIAIHRAGTEAFNRGDFDSALAVFPEDAEWHAVSDDPETSRPVRVRQFLSREEALEAIGHPG